MAERRLRVHRFRFALSLGLALTLCSAGERVRSTDLPAARFPDPVARVSRATLTEAMRRQQALGYNLLVSTTAGRFTAAVLFDLAALARRDRPEGPALLLHYDDWFEAYRACLDLDSGAVPEFVALQRRHRQSQYVEYASAATQVEVREGPTPRQVLRVRAGWVDSAGAAEEYTFVDTAATPDMMVTNASFISYWLVDYGDFILQDRVVGVRGRPLEGALGATFKVVGSGRAQWSRSAITPDGLLLAHVCARKGPFTVHPTTTTYPDGHLLQGLPDDREDLRQVEEILKQDLELSYPSD